MEFLPGAGANTLSIVERLFIDFEAGRGVAPVGHSRVYVLGVTLLHELVHWGDDQDGVDRAGEEGEEFERTVYGGVVPC